jgi:D-alanyl-lipoteichoic acid acyltransferase DltB (MBOAT superfamily)
MKSKTFDQINTILFIILLSVLFIVVLKDYINAQSNLDCWKKAAAQNYEGITTCKSPNEI